jgi:hypothetical protein
VRRGAGLPGCRGAGLPGRRGAGVPGLPARRPPGCRPPGCRLPGLPTAASLGRFSPLCGHNRPSAGRFDGHPPAGLAAPGGRRAAGVTWPRGSPARGASPGHGGRRPAGSPGRGARRLAACRLAWVIFSAMRTKSPILPGASTGRAPDAGARRRRPTLTPGSPTRPARPGRRQTSDHGRSSARQQGNRMLRPGRPDRSRDGGRSKTRGLPTTRDRGLQRDSPRRTKCSRPFHTSSRLSTNGQDRDWTLCAVPRAGRAPRRVGQAPPAPAATSPPPPASRSRTAPRVST